MKNLIIFGAGASYGSDDSQITPPLTIGLIDELVKFAPNAWGALNDKEKNMLKDDFEQAMQELSKTRSHDLTVLQRAMAMYFFKFQPTVNSLYYKLAQKIKTKGWDGTIVTLNYERLLEISLLRVGLQPVCGKETVKNASQVEVCFPHGSCHVFCESVRGTASGIRMSGMNIRTDGPVRPISNLEEYNHRIISDAFPPVMSYFEPQKRTLSGQSFIIKQRRRFTELVKEATKIVIIGLRVRLNDDHIWGPLSESSAKILYCSGSSAKAEFMAWSHENNRTNALDGYFYDNFDKIAEFLDL